MSKYANRLQGKRILVVGGSSGIGFAVAEAAIEFGAIVTVASSTQIKVAKAIERIKASYPNAGDRINGTTCDLSSDDAEGEITRAYKFATNEGVNKLDHVVNTAGDGVSIIKLSDATLEAGIKSSKVRYFGSLLMAKHVGQYMNNSVGSSFTLTGGVQGKRPIEGMSPNVGFATAKEGLTRGLAIDLKPIRVNCVSPGIVKTEIFEFPGGDEMVELWAQKTLTGTYGLPEDLAETYLSIMRNNFLTGQILEVEGGYLLV